MTRITTDYRDRAKPGPWYGQYYQDWNDRHPGAWVRGELVPGGFYSGNLWGSSTLNWDAEWFRRQGAHVVLVSAERSAAMAPRCPRVRITSRRGAA